MKFFRMKVIGTLALAGILISSTATQTTAGVIPWLWEALFGPAYTTPCVNNVAPVCNECYSQGASAVSQAPMVYQPAQSFSAPVYSTPAYSQPVYEQPVYSTPSYSASYAPAYSEPVYSAPVYSAPAYSAPVYSQPSYPVSSYPSYPVTDSYVSSGPIYDGSVVQGGIISSGPVYSGEVISSYPPSTGSVIYDGGIVNNGYVDGGYVDQGYVGGSYPVVNSGCSACCGTSVFPSGEVIGSDNIVGPMITPVENTIPPDSTPTTFDGGVITNSMDAVGSMDDDDAIGSGSDDDNGYGSDDFKNPAGAGSDINDPDDFGGTIGDDDPIMNDGLGDDDFPRRRGGDRGFENGYNNESNKPAVDDDLPAEADDMDSSLGGADEDSPIGGFDDDDPIGGFGNDDPIGGGLDDDPIGGGLDDPIGGGLDDDPIGGGLGGGGLDDSGFGGDDDSDILNRRRRSFDDENEIDGLDGSGGGGLPIDLEEPAGMDSVLSEPVPEKIVTAVAKPLPEIDVQQSTVTNTRLLTQRRFGSTVRIVATKKTPKTTPVRWISAPRNSRLR